VRMLRLLFSALCLPILSIQAGAGAAPGWRIAQATESGISDNIDGRTQASGSLNSVNVVCHLIESAASTYDLPVVFLIRLIWQESRFDLGSEQSGAAA
jgi:hypothetical protein